MVDKIKESEVAGVITSSGKCPVCKFSLLNRDMNYTYIKTRGVARFDNGENYIKCRCGRFVMLSGKVA